jgi:hypothetical protein
MAARLTLGMLMLMLMLTLAKIQFGTQDVCRSEVGWGDYRFPGGRVGMGGFWGGRKRLGTGRRYIPLGLVLWVR